MRKYMKLTIMIMSQSSEQTLFPFRFFPVVLAGIEHVLIYKISVYFKRFVY